MDSLKRYPKDDSNLVAVNHPVPIKPGICSCKWLTSTLTEQGPNNDTVGILG